MTNAIEQAKREMWIRFGVVKDLAEEAAASPLMAMGDLENSLESYLELLRQDHEALHETARKRFEDIQVLGRTNEHLQKMDQYWRGLPATKIISSQDNEIHNLETRLAKMTEERDAIQLRLHAVDHAYKTQQDQIATRVQDSGDRASCATPDAKTMAILGSVLDVQRIVSDWALGASKAKHSMRKIAAVVNGDLEVAKALDAFQSPDRCMHSFSAIGQDQMKCTFCGVGK